MFAKTFLPFGFSNRMTSFDELSFLSNVPLAIKLDLI